MGNGNHDHGNLGLFTHYFGPLVQHNLWGGTSILSFDSIVPIHPELLQWLVDQMKQNAQASRKTYLMFHVPIFDVFRRDIDGRL